MAAREAFSLCLLGGADGVLKWEQRSLWEGNGNTEAYQAIVIMLRKCIQCFQRQTLSMFSWGNVFIKLTSALPLMYSVVVCMYTGALHP